MRSYDSLLESDPEIQQIKRDSLIEGHQRVLIIIVATRFPDLEETAKQQVVRFNNVEDLEQMISLITAAPNEETVRWLLTMWKPK